MAAGIEAITDLRADVSVPELSRSLAEVLGLRLTAVIAGVDDATEIQRWATGVACPPQVVEKRLRRAASITGNLLKTDSPETVRSWFLGMNPILDDHSPALTLATDPDRVELAAQYFAAYG